MMKRKVKFNLLYLIVFGITMIACIVLIFVMFFQSNHYENTTGLDFYTDNDVDINCFLDGMIEKGRTFHSTLDVLFDYQDIAAQFYGKNIYTYEDVVSVPNNIYCEAIVNLNGSNITESFYDECISSTQDYYFLGDSDIGRDSSIERKGNQLILFYHIFEGDHEKYSSSQRKIFIKSIEKKNYRCR